MFSSSRQCCCCQLRLQQVEGDIFGHVLGVDCVYKNDVATCWFWTNFYPCSLESKALDDQLTPTSLVSSCIYKLYRCSAMTCISANHC